MSQKKHEAVSPPVAPHVSLLWVDNANLTRCRVLPLKRFEQPQFQLELTNAVQSMPSTHDAPFDSPVGVVHWVPDHQRTNSDHVSQPAKLYDISAWMEGTRACFGEMTKDGDLWAQCPRTFLRLHERKLMEKLGIQATVGFELEFQLLRPNSNSPTGGDELLPVDTTLYCEVRALQTGSSWTVLREIVECLQRDLGIAVYQYHPESAGGQFEISIGYDGARTSAGDGPEILSLVEAVDQLVLARQTVYGIAAKHGLQATFVPKLRLNDTGSGAHIHLGLIDTLADSTTGGDGLKKKNLFKSRTAMASSFVAGILEELPGMLMLLAPTINSYERLQPHCWAGAYACYGFENREAAIRLIGSNREDVSRIDHFEVKTIDGTANPYVAVGALLAAGMAGVERNLVLPEPMTADPDSLSKEEQKPERLPKSLREAIGAFQERRAEFWNAVLTDKFANLLVNLRTAENEFYGKLTRDELMRQLVRRY
ncbi:hypothetical protein Gpo141_00009031 [Globisporangium polare]